VLARYSDRHGRLREVVTQPGSGGSLLVIDRDVATRGDRRLVAHLASDEPPVNATFACSDYLGDVRRRFCRALTVEDLRVTPICGHHDANSPDANSPEGDLLDRHNRRYRLGPFADGIAVPELRWQRLSREEGCEEASWPLSLREVVATFESYQPMHALTARALSLHRQGPRLSTSTLRCELERMDKSPIVLNRGLREAVRKALANGLSMGEIARRCGRLKRDTRGNLSGDTSWVARRVGLLPPAGKSEPTPWIHSDVLALIARRGLNISPREVELG
jgi:hypothetical protein